MYCSSASGSFRAGLPFQRSLGAQSSKRDPRTPHTSCVITTNLPLEDDEVSLGEICAALDISRVSRDNETYREHRYIPV